MAGRIKKTTIVILNRSRFMCNISFKITFKYIKYCGNSFKDIFTIEHFGLID